MIRGRPRNNYVSIGLVQYGRTWELDMQYNDDTNAVFDNAEMYIDNVKSEYMYMYSDDTHDFFKHIDTRKYQKAIKVQSPKA